MSYLVYFLLIIINLLYGFRKYHNSQASLKSGGFRIRRNSILIVLSFIGCFLLVSGYRNFSGLSGDLQNNENEYFQVVNYGITVYEVGYYFLMKLGVLLNLDFYTWRNILVLFSLSLIFISIYRWSTNPHFVLAFFCAYSLILGAEQFRNFIGLSIFQLGLATYVFSKQRHRKLVFVICTLLAGSIHSLYYVYLIVIFLNYRFKLKWIIAFNVPVLMFCVLIFLNGNNIFGLKYLLDIFGDTRGYVYLLQRTRYGFVLPMLLHCSNIFLVWYAYYIAKDKYIHLLILKINLILVIFFPLYMLNVIFFRIVRNLLIIIYISQGNNIIEFTDSNRRLKLIAMNLLVLSLWVYINLYIFTDYNALLKPFFEDNIYFINIFSTL